MANAKYLDKNGLIDVLKRIKDMYTSVQTISFRGLVRTISELPNIDSIRAGYMYSIQTGGYTTDDFVEGAGQVIQNGESVVCVNVNTDIEPILKWDVVGGVFDITDRLQFGQFFPIEPQLGDTFLYMGPTVFDYAEVTPVGDENPVAENWYEWDPVGERYAETLDTEVNPEKTYYKQVEKYKKGIIYVYSLGGIWAPQPNGDVITGISNAEIDALFR